MPLPPAPRRRDCSDAPGGGAQELVEAAAVDLGRPHVPAESGSALALAHGPASVANGSVVGKRAAVAVARGEEVPVVSGMDEGGTPAVAPQG